MSMEMFVLSDRRLDSIAAWQEAIDRAGFNLRLDTSRTFDQLSGHLPAWRDEEHAGFECDQCDAAEILDAVDDLEFDHRYPCCLAFRFGGDLFAMWGAAVAAAAYTVATGGVLLECESGELLTAERAIEFARQTERDNESIGWSLDKLLGSGPAQP